MGEEAIASACPCRPCRLSLPGAGSERPRLCLPPLSLWAQPFDSDCRNALNQGDGSLNMYLQSVCHMPVQVPILFILPSHGSFPVLCWSPLSDSTHCSEDGNLLDGKMRDFPLVPSGDTQ